MLCYYLAYTKKIFPGSYSDGAYGNPHIYALAGYCEMMAKN